MSSRNWWPLNLQFSSFSLYNHPRCCTTGASTKRTSAQFKRASGCRLSPKRSLKAQRLRLQMLEHMVFRCSSWLVLMGDTWAHLFSLKVIFFWPSVGLIIHVRGLTLHHKVGFLYWFLFHLLLCFYPWVFSTSANKTRSICTVLLYININNDDII